MIPDSNHCYWVIQILRRWNPHKYLNVVFDLITKHYDLRGHSLAELTKINTTQISLNIITCNVAKTKMFAITYETSIYPFWFKSLLSGNVIIFIFSVFTWIIPFPYVSQPSIIFIQVRNSPWPIWFVKFVWLKINFISSSFTNYNGCLPTY